MFVKFAYNIYKWVFSSAIDNDLNQVKLTWKRSIDP